MAPHARWLLLPLAVGPCLALAQERAADAAPRGAYHREYATAVRPDPPPSARAPAWGSWCDGSAACPGWTQGDGTPVPQARRWWADGAPHGRRPDPNLRRAEVPTPDSRGWSGPVPWWQDGANPNHGADAWSSWREPDDRARHGWRAGWHGAAPGWGGVWWYGWGGDWPVYADAWQPGGWGATRWTGWQGGGNGHGYVQIGYGRGRGGYWHGDIHYGQGWNSGRWHGEIGVGQGWSDGPHVIALPSPRGD